MEPKDVAKLEQYTTFITNTYPGVWRQIYLKLVDEGFTEAQAFELVKVYISASCHS